MHTEDTNHISKGQISAETCPFFCNKTTLQQYLPQKSTLAMAKGAFCFADIFSFLLGYMV